jgi:chemotaxis protein methyltransferase CheR
VTPTASPDALLHAFATELRRTLGLVFPPSRAQAFEAGIGRAATALREVPASLLLRLAAGDGAAIDELARELTIGETYFFRHPHHFDFLRDALRAIARDRPAGEPIRLWSAGCSSGEEAYSMAIAALEALGPVAERTVAIVGTDVNPDCVARARAATYGEWSFRNVEPDVRARWFESDGPRFRVADAPRAMVRFAARNLLDGPPPSLPGDGRAPGIDVIFCRNVLIYFEPAAIERVTAELARALALGGWMVPGPSDPLLRRPELVVSAVSGLITYRRAHPAVAVVAITPPARVVPSVAPSVAARPLHAPPLRPMPVIPPRDAVERARRLADGGDLAAALALIEEAVLLDPLRGEVYALRAVLAQARGDHPAAAADADRAILLQSGFAFAHVIAASSRAQLGERVEARRHVRNAQRLLAALVAEEGAPGSGGVTARELLHACRQLDRSLGSASAGGASGGRR